MSLAFAALRTSAGGNVALFSALTLPVLAIFVAGGVEVGFTLNDRVRLQAAADAAALAGAQELVLAETGVTERAEDWVEAQLADVLTRSTVLATAAVMDGGGSLQVDVVANRPSFFGNLVPPGGFTTRVSAVATAMGSTPLCVLVHGGQKSYDRDGLKLRDTAVVNAPGCLVHSNIDLKVEGGAKLQAGAAQSVGASTGAISPAAQVGAEPIKDPFEGKDLTIPSRCDTKALEPKDGDEIPAGVHCGDIIIRYGSVTLASGDHYFSRANLRLTDSARLTGSDVALYFDGDSHFDFSGTSKVNLSGRRSGPYAGFVVVTFPKWGKQGERQNGHDFRIASDRVDKLEGVVYLPEAKLVIEGRDKVAENSAWTVIVAKKVEVTGSATLQINKDYTAAGVPSVPDGVGPTRTDVRLAD